MDERPQIQLPPGFVIERGEYVINTDGSAWSMCLKGRVIFKPPPDESDPVPLIVE